MFIDVVVGGEKRRLEAEPGAILSEVLAAANLGKGTECNRGVCGKCAVRLLSGTVGDRGGAGTARCPDGQILACRSVLGDSDIAIEIEGERADIQRKVRLPKLGRGENPGDRPVRKIYLELAPPTLSDQTADVERILAALSGVTKVRPGVLGKLPTLLRKAAFRVTAIVSGNELCGVQAGDASAKNYGFVIDIGTTTIAIYLIDVNTGESIDARGLANPQRIFGADVLSRISACADGKSLEKLQSLVVEGIGEAMRDLEERHGVEPQNVHSLVVVGNPAMTHLFMGVEPASLAVSPFIPCCRQRIGLSGVESGLPLHPGARVEVLANISGFVGSDALGVAMATRPWEKAGWTLAVDIGTNGEILLGRGDELYACSAAAGPAFEGAHIAHGMRAGEGAIEKVRIRDGRIELQVIGDCAPKGICGSGLLDGIAEMLRACIITESGRFATGDEAFLHPALKARLRTGAAGVREFVLAFASRAGSGQDIVITQKDIREFQLAKAAIAAGIAILCKEAGIAPEEVERLYLAGAFGNYLDRENAAALGIFPGIAVEKIIPVGNAAAEGAGHCLVSLADLARSDEAAAGAQAVELSAHADFTDLWVRQMDFPKP